MTSLREEITGDRRKPYFRLRIESSYEVASKNGDDIAWIYRF